MATIENLSAATPSEIDAKLSELYVAEEKYRNRLEMAVLSIHRVAGDKGTYVTKNRKVPSMKWTVALEIAATVAHRPENPDLEAKRALGHWAEAKTKLQEIRRAADPLNAEFERRGGWTRAFLVQNANGHVHRSMHCSSCFVTTSFVWMTEYSGQDENGIVEDAAERACTVCYPTAPVEVRERPTKMFGPDEIEAQKAKADREAKAAEKIRQANEKGIVTPEGGAVHTSTEFRRYDVAKTLRTAEIALTDAIYELIREQQHAEDPEWAGFYADGRNTEKEQARRSALIGHLLWAIAFKKDETTEETFKIHLAKAEAKIRKVDRDWAKDPRNPNRAK